MQQPDGSYRAGPGWQYGYNATSETPSIWSESRSEIISYDDPASLEVKRESARGRALGGMMFWAVYGDTDDGELIRVLN